ncbi:tetratricopeptide repeat protein [Fusobacterium polymorphum]|uniref:tetratricopeptide repeat protein n=1 Tax=Fusobacterium nucleatum subsp. polymorphum TaxID=76857 RepID=UPI002B4BEBA5|nr:tetratricopeptide repeat protein [Fusobacterium polymorphum]WRL71997.1 tetratricopeptide repeat protein [Fusobacterium polymorphum]
MDEKEREELLKEIEDYTKKIEEDPNNASYYNNRGITFNNLKKYKEAIEDYSEAIKLNPNYSLAYNNRGVSFYNLKDYNKAIEDYNMAIKLNPNYPLTYNNRGNTFFYKKEYENAIKDYSEAIKLKPEKVSYYNNRGDAFFYKKEYENAIKDYSEAIKLKPKEASYYNNRGNAFFYKKEYENAIKDYSEAIKLKPEKVSYYNNRGDAFFYKKEYENAIKDYSEAIKLKPKEASYYYNRGLSFYNLKEYDEAVKDYSEAIKLKPEKVSYYNNRGNAFFYKKEYENAIKDYSEAIKLKPKEASYYYNRGLSFYNLKEYDEAIKDYTKAIEINPNYDLAIKNKNIILEESKKNIKIENNLEESKEITKKKLIEKKQIDKEIIKTSSRITDSDSNYSLIFNKINSLYMTGNYKEIEKELLPRIQDFKKESEKQVKTPEIENLIRKVDLIERIFNEKPKKLEGYLIFADILGWKGIWKKQDKKDIANVTFFIKNILEKEFDRELKEKKYNISLISDTFIVFSKEWELSNKLSKKLIELCLENDLVIRGAISYGECYNKDTVYVGPAVDEAASWHDEGEEIGIFCTPSAKQEIINNDYDLPEDFIKLKSGEINTFFINWYNKETKKKFDELFSKIDKSSIKVYLKYLNTEKKFDKYLKEEKK